MELTKKNIYNIRSIYKVEVKVNNDRDLIPILILTKNGRMIGRIEYSKYGYFAYYHFQRFVMQSDFFDKTILVLEKNHNLNIPEKAKNKFNEIFVMYKLKSIGE